MRSQIHHLLAESAAARGDASALTFKDVTVTYASSGARWLPSRSR